MEVLEGDRAERAATTIETAISAQETEVACFTAVLNILRTIPMAPARTRLQLEGNGTATTPKYRRCRMNTRNMTRTISSHLRQHILQISMVISTSVSSRSLYRSLYSMANWLSIALSSKTSVGPKVANRMSSYDKSPTGNDTQTSLLEKGNRMSMAGGELVPTPELGKDWDANEGRRSEVITEKPETGTGLYKSWLKSAKRATQWRYFIFVVFGLLCW